MYEDLLVGMIVLTNLDIPKGCYDLYDVKICQSAKKGMFYYRAAKNFSVKVSKKDFNFWFNESDIDRCSVIVL